MIQLHPVYQAFLAALRESEDHDTALIFADWLEERDETELAQRFRAGLVYRVKYPVRDWWERGVECVLTYPIRRLVLAGLSATDGYVSYWDFSADDEFDTWHVPLDWGVREIAPSLVFREWPSEAEAIRDVQEDALAWALRLAKERIAAVE